MSGDGSPPDRPTGAGPERRLLPLLPLSDRVLLPATMVRVSLSTAAPVGRAPPALPPLAPPAPPGPPGGGPAAPPPGPPRPPRLPL